MTYLDCFVEVAGYVQLGKINEDHMVESNKNKTHSQILKLNFQGFTNPGSINSNSSFSLFSYL